VNELVKRFAEAIAHAEGFYVEGSLPSRCHNPGDLAVGDRGLGTALSAGYGAADITIFASAALGWNALYSEVERILSGTSRIYRPQLTLLEVGAKYAMDANWGRNVAKQLGVAPEITLGELASSSTQNT
jgi:hypothetical protein